MTKKRRVRLELKKMVLQHDLNGVNELVQTAVGFRDMLDAELLGGKVMDIDAVQFYGQVSRDIGRGLEIRSRIKEELADTVYMLRRY